MINENKIQILSELLRSIKSQGKKDYALQIVNNLIESYNSIEKILKSVKEKKIGLDPGSYDMYLNSCIDILQTIGFDHSEIVMMDKKALAFINKHRHKIKKPMTYKHFMDLINLYRYYIVSFDEEPKNLTDLKNAYTEIERNRD